jgi:predicted ATPase
MLTRLQVSGFKNLVGVDVRFGPFTCIAGANGIGKSNLFDAIHFLSLLADRPLIEAAQGVRGGRTAGVRSLFHRVGEGCVERMSFEAEMIVPPAALDDLRQEAKATITFLRYRLVLGYRPDRAAPGPLEILEEELRHIPKGEAHKHLLFEHSAGRWRGTAILGERRAPYFISTDGEGDERVIQLHQDGGSRGRPLRYSAAQLPRTVLSGSNAAESPTAVVARREMQSWRLLQLEPSALRRPDEFTSSTKLGSDGSHLAATLYRLSQLEKGTPGGDGRVYARVANRLAELVEDVRAVRVDRDERRELLTLQVIDRSGTEHPAPSLSDGSLRFLALAVLELDPESQGLICMEEPENGVYPERIPAMLQLLQDVAVDVEEPVDRDNPLRQVIINTHSPAVVAQVPEESLLVAQPVETVDERLGRFDKVELHPLPDTWRTRAPESLEPIPYGKLLAYLNPVNPRQFLGWRPARRVVDRPDVQNLLLPFPDSSR